MNHTAAQLHAWMYKCLHECTHACTWMYAHSFICAYGWMHAHTWMHACIWMYTGICISVHMNAHAPTRVDTGTLLHT